ncbi:MAG TPA: AarF/ABC1/UbiB kinase family protein, partial [Proteiniclasticum sp.]|nr:AarF/ABC1/UbiB kinase family protein [Proteiniclasticum sp.]
KRFREIVRVLASYGFGHIIHAKFRSEKMKNDPENLRLVFEELGPTFIKIGQILSTRPDVLPAEYISELSKLQDKAPHFPYETVVSIIEEELGRPLAEIFSSIDETPMACASVAQVHTAVLLDGKKVIVKVQRPDIEEKLLEDINILIRIVKRAPNTLRDILLDPVEALEEILENTRIELDFNNEVLYMLRFKEENESIKCISIPNVFLNLSTKRIVVQEEIPGIKITDREKLLSEGYDMEDIGKKLVLSYLYQLFNNGFFHGDPHPGNLIIHEKKIYYIDFGIMGSLTQKARRSINYLLQAMVKRDIGQLVNLVMDLAQQKGPVDKNVLYEDIEYIIHYYLQTSLKNIQVSRLFMDLFEAARKNNLKLPKEFTTLLKSLLILEGVISEISPELSIMEIAKDYLKEDPKISLWPDFTLDTLAINSYNLVKDTLKIPVSIQTILDNFISGRGKVKLDIVNFDDRWVDFNKMINRMVFAVVVSAIIIASALIIRSGEGPNFNGISLVGIMGFALAGLLGLWLLISILKSGNI